MKITKSFKKVLSKPEYVFLTLALIFGTLSALLMPQLIANDENMHFMRSFQLTEMQFKHECKIPRDVKDRGFFAIYARDAPDFSFNTKKINIQDKVDTDCGTATSYNPILHTPQLLGVLVSKLFWPTTAGMILFGRLFNVITYSLFMFLIIRMSKIGKWMIVVISLLPTTIHMAGSLTGDVMNNVILTSFIVFVFNIFVQRTEITKKQIVILFGLSLLLGATKPPYIALIAILMFVPKKRWPALALKGKKLPKNFIKLCIVGICGFLSLLLLFLWLKLYGGSALGPSGDVDARAYSIKVIAKVFFNTFINTNNIFGGISYSDWLMRSAVGSFASFRFHLPYSIVSLILLMLFVVGARNDKKEGAFIADVKKSLMVGSLLIFTLIFCAITYSMYIAWAVPNIGTDASFALGLQGRYFSPILLLFAPLFISFRKYLSVEVKNDAVLGALVSVVMGGSMVFYLAQTIILL